MLRWNDGEFLTYSSQTHTRPKRYELKAESLVNPGFEYLARSHALLCLKNKTQLGTDFAPSVGYESLSNRHHR
jgi:hypothetical protein